MGEQKVEALVEGANATPAPPLAPALAPLGVNLGQVVNTINEKTKEFEGIEVPVTVIVDTDTKDYKVEVGTPPVSALIKNELNLEKGSEKAGEEEIADIRMEQIIKIAKMKEDSMLGLNLKNKVKQIVGTCQSMGVLVEKETPIEAMREIEDGKFDKKIEEEKTELTEEELKELEEEKKKLKEKIEKEHEQMRQRAQEILDVMEGEEKGEIRRAMREEEIDDEIIEEFVPHEAAVEGAPPEEGGEGVAEEGPGE